ncbi:MAG: ABC transporter permease, partial [Clostridia bacterium]|nr:ABC transporter permease [Clostridia bacterium]
MIDKYDVNNIPAEKFQFATRNDLYHDSKFETKPVTYFQGAFRRFSKNKGAVVGGIVIMFLVLFAIIAPFFTPFQPAYYDMMYSYVTPKNKFFAESGINFWDGCKVKNTNYLGYLKDLAMASETGRDIIKGGEYTVSEDGSNYTYRYDTYYGVGFGKYKIISQEEFLKIQQYQNETGRQILYPIVPFSDRNQMLEKNKYDANIYYKVDNLKASTLRPKLDFNGNIIPNYWSYEAGNPSNLVAEYNSLRIEGEDGIKKDGKQHFYVYGRRIDGGIEVRAEYYEYYIYQHTQIKGDGIEEPLFLFGTTETGKDIFACLAYGARFSFIFATVVAAVNFIVGVIWGSISGYFGGKIDLFMERFAEILGSVPTMIVITLLKYHMGSTRQALVLFIAFFATGLIGMAGRTRMQFYRFKNQEYVLAARTLG